MAVTTVTANEVTGCTKDNNKDKVRQRRQRRQQEMAVTTAMANEVTGCTEDNDKGETRRRRQRETKGDKGRQRRQYWRTQETKEMVKEGGQATLMVREGSKPL